jgi:hypothetical protein
MRRQCISGCSRRPITAHHTHSAGVGLDEPGLIMACFLVKGGLGPDEALARLAELRQGEILGRPSPENEEQRRFVFDWQNYVQRTEDRQSRERLDPRL